MAKGIDRGAIPPHVGRIPPAMPPPEEDLRFSFKHIDLQQGKFSVDRCRKGYLHCFLDRLRAVCRIRVQEFRTNRSPSLRAHRICFAETSEPNGFAHLNEQLRAEEAWQFEITSNKHGRVHGLLVDDTFYVVWIDPDHQLYSE
jgi:hypothetical protein